MIMSRIISAAYKCVLFSLMINNVCFVVDAGDQVPATFPDDPICLSIDPTSGITLVSSPGPTFVNTNTGGDAGDLSIAAFDTNAYKPASGFPTYTGRFRINDLEMQAICTVRKPGFSAPECRLEFKLHLCNRARLLVLPDKFKAEFDSERFVPVPPPEPVSNIRGTKTVLESDSRLDNSKELDSRAKVDERFQDIAVAYKYSTICAANTVLNGRFTAIGTGPASYPITGGTGDFFGAFGFVDAVFDPVTSQYSLNQLDLCYYDY
jgi:hypothetical protein